MTWQLEMVRVDDGGRLERMPVIELGMIGAPSGVDGVGMHLTTAQYVLSALQSAVVTIQEQALKARAAEIRRADPTLFLKDYRSRSVQSLFGTLVIHVPRLVRRGSRLAPPCFFQSSARSSTEYNLLRSRLGAFMSFRMAEGLIGDLFPCATGQARSTARRHVLRQAAQIESVATRTGQTSPQPCAAINLGIDTTFVRSAAADGARHHEVLIGVGSNDRAETVKLGAVIAVTDKPHRIIEHTLHALSHTGETQIISFTDGDKMLRGYLKLAGLSAPLLDWAHLARRVQIAKITAKGLRNVTIAERRTRPKILKAMDSIHWRLWHGRIERARKAMRQVITMLRHFECDRPRAQPVPSARKLRAAIGKLEDYVAGQSAYLTNYGKRQRHGKPVGTATTEGLANSLVNQRMNKRQQMRWSAQGAHAVVTVRAHHFNSANATRLALGHAA
ncbi:MAG: hypothetical protein P8Y48_16910 [Novosphingobium sp.]